MPLKKGTSQKTFGANVSEMVKAGHPQEQAVAAAYEQQRRSRKRHDGRPASDAAPTNFALHDSVVMDAVHRSPSGYLAAEARCARIGTQRYRGSELGMPEREYVTLYRPEAEVFNRDAMHSMAWRPVTLKHPPVMVDPTNWAKYAKGVTGDEVVRDGGFVKVPITLMDQAIIDAVESDGCRELSLGYTTDISWESGTTPDGEQYDGVQRQIRANHLAVVPMARGGKNLRFGDALTQCPNCGTALTGDPPVCPSCGADLKPAMRVGDHDNDEMGDAELGDKEFSAEERRDLAKRGLAKPDGCLAGETRIITLDGTAPIAALVGQSVELLTRDYDGKSKWVRSEIRSFGVQRLYRVSLRSDGGKRATVFATEGHRWYIGDDKAEVSLTIDLKRGDVLTLMEGSRGEITSRTCEAWANTSGLHGLQAADSDESILMAERSSGLPAGLQRLHFQESARMEGGPVAGTKCGEILQDTITQCVWDQHGRIRDAGGRTGWSMRAMPETGRSRPALGSGSLSSDGRNTRASVHCLQYDDRAVGRFGRRDCARVGIPEWTVTSVAATRRVEEVYCAIVPGTARFVLDHGILTGNSYPIRNKSDLGHAIQAWGRGGATASDKAWIIKRARALGATSDLPEDWVKDAAMDGMEGGKTMVQIMVDGMPIEIGDERQAAILQRHLAALTDKKKNGNGNGNGNGDDDDDADEVSASQKKEQKYTDAIKEKDETISAKDGEIAALRKQLQDATFDEAKQDQKLDERQALRDALKPLLPAGYDPRGKKEMELYRTAVANQMGDAAAIKDWDDKYVIGACRAYMHPAAKTAGGARTMADGLSSAMRLSADYMPGNASRAAISDAEKARAEYIADLQNAYKTPMSHQRN